MCGRFAAAREAEDLAAELDIDEIAREAEQWRASWNIAPTNDVRVVVERSLPDQPGRTVGHPRVARELHVARWGLLPPWSPGPQAPGPVMFNARIETVATKRTFAPSLRTRRCLVPADSYYEWKTAPAHAPRRAKTPFLIRDPSGASLTFAGLYAWWRAPGTPPDASAPWQLSTTILTRAARDGLADIHDREPVVLARDAIDTWLDPALQDPQEALGAANVPGPRLEWYEVSARVGSVRNDDQSLTEPV